MLAAAALATGLVACARQPADPVGTYLRQHDGQRFVLYLLAGGDYRLLVDGPAGRTREILGRWEKDEPPMPALSLHGIIWQRGRAPEAGHGIWIAATENNDDICLDAEELDCFERVEGAGAKAG